MAPNEEERMTLTCTACGFMVSMSRFQAHLQGWYIPVHTLGVALCANCAPGEAAVADDDTSRTATPVTRKAGRS
jgi:hypothetical protein